MLELDPRYLTDLAGLIGNFSSFLGGFSATFFVTLLTLAKPGMLARITIAAAAFAAISFIVAVGYSLSINLAMHPNAPELPGTYDIAAGRIGLTISFMLGLLALLLSIGMSGWIRSRGLGLMTSTAAAIGAVIVLNQIS